MLSTSPVKIELSAGGVCYRRTDGEFEVLLIKDSYGNWGFPKGHLEPGETARDAALRECREETGLTRLRLLDELGTIDWYFRFGDNVVHKFCDFYLVETDRADRASPQSEQRIQACRWMRPEAALSQITYSNAEHVLRLAIDQLSHLSQPKLVRGSPTTSRPFARGK